jgi:hypothetical protein
MAKRLTIESCLNEEPHDEHEFRPAIFGIGRKVLCQGVPTPPHKHKLILQNQLRFIDPLKLVWWCECGKFVSCYRDDFHLALKDPLWYPTRTS